MAKFRKKPVEVEAWQFNGRDSDSMESAPDSSSKKRSHTFCEASTRSSLA